MRLLINILIFLLLCTQAYATNWCNNANTELCITFEDDISDDSSNNFTITNNGVTRTSGSAPASYSTYYGDFEDTESDYLHFTDATGIVDYEANTEDFSVCAWVDQEDTSQYQFIFMLQDSNDDFWRFMIWNDDDVRLSLDAVDLEATTNAGSTWVHLCATVDRDGNTTFYRNGSADGTAASSSETLDITDTEFLIGINEIGGAYDFDGLMDDLLIYTGILSQSDITDIYTNGLSGGLTKPILGTVVID